MILTYIQLHINYVREPNLTHVLDINTKLHLFPLTSHAPEKLTGSWIVAGACSWPTFQLFCIVVHHHSLWKRRKSSGKSVSPEEKVKYEIPQIPNTLRNKVMLLSMTSGIGKSMHNFNHDPITYIHFVRENMHLIYKRD